MNGRHTFYRTLIVIFTLAGLYLLWELGEIIIVVLGAIILASAIRPFVNRLNGWGLPRGLAILFIYLVGLASFGGLLAISVPPLIGVVTELVEEGSLIRRLGAMVWRWAAQLGYGQIGQDLSERIVTEWNQLDDRLQILFQSEGVSILRSTAEALSQLILALVVAFYWLTARDQFQNLLLSVTPIRHRDKAAMLFDEVERTLGDYVRGTGILMFSIGLAAFVGLSVLRVPFALPLALLAGLFEAVPLVGATLGALPAVLVALTVSPTTGALTILLFVVIQFLENNILVPRIHEHAVGLNPLVVLIAVVAGGMLNGIVGALLAIPIAGAAQVMFTHLIVAPMIEEASESHEEQGIRVFDVEEEERTSEGVLIARS
jgi:predicted PurR-regulated permease PerM